jgi:hypothetical protein
MQNQPHPRSTEASQWPLKSINVDQLANLHERQSAQFDWNLSNEREFVENLFCQRFNFMLVLYSLFIAAAASANTQLKLIAILGLGGLVTMLTSFTIWRAYVKLIVNFKMLYRLEDHPISVVAKENNLQSPIKRAFPVNSILGIWIPLICSSSLVAGFILACTNHLKAT